MTKITFIGAGSFGFTRGLVRDILTFPLLKDATLALMDIDAERLVFCSGKIYHELCAERARRGDTKTAIVCIVELYPFAEAAVRAELKRHANARKVLWVQEEPANMGALAYIRPILRRLAAPRHVTTVKRSASASPATGSAKAHALEQQTLIMLAFA